MPQIQVTIVNLTGHAQIVHVFDTFHGGTRPVDGNPFELVKGERSTSFGVNADARGSGQLAYRSRSGMVRTGIEVSEGTSVEIR